MAETGGTSQLRKQSAATPSAITSDDGLRGWAGFFGFCGWLSVISLLIWALVAWGAAGDAFDRYRLGSEKAQETFNRALLWSVVSLTGALSNFFCSALLRGASDVIKLLKAIASSTTTVESSAAR